MTLIRLYDFNMAPSCMNKNRSQIHEIIMQRALTMEQYFKSNALQTDIIASTVKGNRKFIQKPNQPKMYELYFVTSTGIKSWVILVENTSVI